MKEISYINWVAAQSQIANHYPHESAIVFDDDQLSETARRVVSNLEHTICVSAITYKTLYRKIREYSLRSK